MEIATKTLTFVLLLVLQTFQFAYAQEAKTPQVEPQTKLEALQGKSGTLIVRGFSSVGTVNFYTATSVVMVGNTIITKNNWIEVECDEMTDITSGSKVSGIILKAKSISSATQSAEKLESISYSYIDHDEIDSLLKGIDYIKKIDKTATKLDSFQANYTTRGGLVLSANSSDGGESVFSVRIGRTGGSWGQTGLEDFKQLIKKSKEILDKIKN
jgi:hypothetical protein